MRRAAAFSIAALAMLLPPGGPGLPPADRTAWRETDWSRHLAGEMGGQAAARTPDGSRVDLLTEEVAGEVDWCGAGKWSQGIGQALYYGLATNKKPGLILLQKDPERERRYYLRALAVCARYGITLRVVVTR